MIFHCPCCNKAYRTKSNRKRHITESQSCEEEGSEQSDHDETNAWSTSIRKPSNDVFLGFHGSTDIANQAVNNICRKSKTIFQTLF